MREIKVFVSSPDDALQERKRLAQVVERLNGEIRGFATIRPVRWETSFYKAHATFQTQIPEAADCDVVVGILRHRLGTALPNDFPKMPSGDPYPSGTAYEVLSAMEKRRTSELPDVYVFRFTEPPTIRLDDATGRRAVEEQWERVKAFFSTWFVTMEGQFKAAFQTFASTDDFEKKVESMLRQWIDEHLLKGRAVIWPIEYKGSPFRGLEAFDVDHASVFFGRSRDIARAIVAFKEAADRGTPYLMVIGPSGAGKSSLARAGILPRITAPGVVPQVDAWRVVMMRPGERGANPFAAFAEQLLQQRKDQGADATEIFAALPEIVESGFRTPKELADLLAHGDDSATKPIIHALDRIAEAERQKGGYERPVTTALLLLIDQLDELLAVDVADETRERFAALLAKLVATRRVWVVSTLRADLYEPYIAVADLRALKTEGASYDLQPPGQAELAEIVRLPARAANLVYESDAAGRTLDERLLADAERADILPLVQFTLNRLFEERISADGDVVLTHAAYDAIGGLDGAIDNEAERAVARLDEAEVRALPRLIRQLAAQSSDAEGGEASRTGPLTTRTVPLEQAAPDASTARLVEALVGARIVLATGDEKARTIRIAHQRVLESWKRARDIVTANVDFFRIREEVEDERRRWEAGGRSRDRLIPRGLRLAEAESIQKRFSDEITPQAQAFIQASGNRARLWSRLSAASAVIFFGVAIAAGYLGWLSQRHAAAEQEARQEAQRMATAEHEASEQAQRNFSIAKQTVDGIIAQVTQGLRGSVGVPTETIRKVLSNLESAVDGLNQSATDDPSLKRSRAAMLRQFGETYASAGESPAAIDAYEEAISISRGLLAEDPGDVAAQRLLAEALERLGDISYRIGKPAEAMAALTEGIDLNRKLAVVLNDEPGIWSHISNCLNLIGDLKRRAGDSAGALADYAEGVNIGRRLVTAEPMNVAWQEGLAISLIHLGDVKAALGEFDGSLEAFAEGLATWRKIAATDPGNMLWLHEVGMALNSIGDIQLGAGQVAEATASFEEGLAIDRRLHRADPEHRRWQGDLATSLERVGDIRVWQKNLPAARALFEESLEIRRSLVTFDLENREWQRDVSSSLFRLGDVKLASDDAEGMQAAYAEGIEILRRLTSVNPNNTRWQRNLAGALKKAGDQKYKAGETAAAFQFYEQAADIRRRLLELDPANKHWRLELLTSLEGVARTATGARRAEAATAALAILGELRAEGALSEEQSSWDGRLRAMLE